MGGAATTAGASPFAEGRLDGFGEALCDFVDIMNGQVIDHQWYLEDHPDFEELSGRVLEAARARLAAERGTPQDRLRDFLRHSGLSQSEFERRCGLPRAWVSHMRRAPSAEARGAIALAFPELNADWLETGEGRMLGPSPPSSEGGLAREERGLWRAMVEMREERIREMDSRIREQDARIRSMETALLVRSGAADDSLDNLDNGDKPDKGDRNDKAKS